MQLAVIKHLSETYSLELLKKAEEALYEEQSPEIIVDCLLYTSRCV